MPIELAGIQLNRVHKVTTLEQAAFVYHRIPGLEGNVVQDLGRDSVRLQVEGIFYGSKAKEDLETLRKVYKKREAVDFLAEVVGQAYFGQVTLERFEVAQVAGAPEQFSYVLVVTEYVEPPPTATAGASAVNTAVSLEAQAFMDIASLPDLLQMGQIPELTNPAEPMSGALDQVTTASSGVSAIAESIGALFQLKVEPTPEGAKLPDGWGQPPELTWSSPPPLPSTAVSPPQLFGANGELLTPDGKPLTGPNGELLGADGKPLSTGWLVIELKDETETAVPDIAYTLTLPDGTILQGTLDTQGQSRIQNLPSGDLQLTFPGLDAGDWLAPAAPDGETDKPPTDGGDAPTATGWLVIELVDENGRFAANTPYQLTLPDGTIRQGTLDAQGRANEENLPDGDLQLTFPDLDAGDWLAPATPAGGDDTTGGSGGIPPDDKPDEPPTGDGVTTEGWLTIELVDENGRFAANTPYQLTLPDGTTRQGTLDAQGRANEENLPDGDLQLTFPDLDAGDWLAPATPDSELPGGEPSAGEGGADGKPTDGETDKPPTDGGDAPTVTGWLVIELVDENGRFAANTRYLITQPDGTTQEGTLDAQGRTQIEGLVAGDYTLTFPDLDANDWAMPEQTEETTPPPPATQFNWLFIEVTDENNQPASGLRYTLTGSDGAAHEGVLNEQGQVRVDGLPSGKVVVTFPELDGHDWDDDSPEPEPQKGWLTIELRTESGTAVPNTRYVLTLADGTVYEGTLDEHGQARIEDLALGPYTLSFPDLDGDDWLSA